MRALFVCCLLLCPLSLEAQWTHRYPPVDGFDHQVYLEAYELPILSSGPMDPAPSPNGGELAFSARGWLWLLEPGSGFARRLTSSAGSDSRPEWFPDGKGLVFVRDTGDQLEIVALDLESREETVLVDGEAVNLDPVVSRDGAWVYYASAESGPLELWRVSLDTQEREQITHSEEVQRRTVKRRPLPLNEDGQLLFLHKQGYYDAVELLDTTTGERTTLLEDWITAQADLALSPDGTLLAYVWPYDGGHELRLLAVAEPSTSVLLTRSAGLPLAPAFSHDGAWVYFAEAGDDERTGLKRIPVAGGAVEPVPVAELDWGAPTGRLVVRTEVDGSIGPVRMNVLDASGHPVVPEAGAVRFEGQNGRVFFYSPGEIELIAAAGEVVISAVQGFETPEATQKAVVQAGTTTTVTVALERIWDASAHGWFSGDNHFHLNYGGIYRLDPEDIVPDLEGEGVDIAFPLLANLHNRFLEPELRDWGREELPLIEFGQEVRSHFLGHVELLGIDELFWPWVWGPGYQVYASDDRLNAEALRHARARGGLGGYVHPVGGEEPFAEESPASVPKSFVADAVLGEVDLLEVACLWTDEIGDAALWHGVLNLGIPLAASAGSDVMNDYYRTMPIGATRLYVRPEGELSAGSYLAALKQGRSFLSTGPMLELEVDGRGPGEVVEAAGDTVGWTLDVHSALPFDKLEIFVNGEVVETRDGSPTAGRRSYAGELAVPVGGWITARVTGENSGWPALDSYLYGETSPVWFGAVGSTDPEVASASAEKLLTVLDRSRESVREGYGETPIPKLLEQFDEARARLQELANGDAR